MKHFSEETRRRMSESAKRRCETEKFKAQVSSYWQPFCTAEALRHEYIDIGMSQEEIAAKYSVSTKRVETSMRRYGIPPRRRIKRNQNGEHNANWVGAAASYKTAHNRVRQALGKPQRCDVCGTSDRSKRYEWANLSGRYLDTSDYRRMCKSCHSKHDTIHRNFGPPI